MCGHASRRMRRLEQQKLWLRNQSGVALFVKSETRQGDSDMATVEQQTPHAHNGTNGATHAGADISVENPATGGIAGSVPDLDAAAVAELAKRARAAQPQWEAFG